MSQEWANKIKQFMDEDQKAGDPTNLNIYNYGGSPVATPVR